MDTTPKVITETCLSHKVLQAEYAVRGLVPTLASQLEQKLKIEPQKYPFSDITKCNIGNPLIFGQKPVTFNRQVLAATLSPDLLEKDAFHEDVKRRARFYKDSIGKTSSVGAYSDSAGYHFVRESVCKFIAQRDNSAPPDPDNIFLSDGASQAIQLILQALVQDSRDGIMIPIPQYPLYSAVICLLGGSECHYYLDEEKGWQVSKEELEFSYGECRRRGVIPKAIVVINPGNPTGTVFKKETIEEIIKFASENNLAILADEVYQKNIYTTKTEFLSFKKVSQEMPSPYNKTELFSFHSTSKGLLGECGLRGGYCEMTNIDQKVKAQLIKLKSVYLCSNTVGQLCVELMVNPPSLGTDSPETVELYNQEIKELYESLKVRANVMTEMLNQMKMIKSNEVEGAMYAYARVFLSRKFVNTAKQMKMEPDLLYCINVLENTGIVLVPGSGFRQRAGTYHFRMSNLILPEEKLKQKMGVFKEYNEKLQKQYEDEAQRAKL